MTAQADYDRFRDSHTELSALVDALADEAAALGLAGRSAHLRSVGARLADSRFRLMVLGEFKRGKSTLVNALLGAPVLPTRVAPCTGMITVVKYGPTPAARLVPADPDQPPEAVPIESIRQHITISLRDDPDEEPPVSTQRVPRMELFHPLPMLQNGVELVDSPGLNEHATRTALALEDLPRADAVVLVLSCEQQLGHTELAFLDRQLTVGPDGALSNVFFVWNRFDAIADDPEEVAALQALTDRVLTPRLGGRARVFCTSARDALVGRVKGDPARLARSGLPELEAALAHFLTTERGRVKLLGPLQSVQNALGELRGRVLPERAALLRAPVEALMARLDDLEPGLEAVQERRRVLTELLRDRQKVLTRRLRVRLGMFGERIRDGLPDAIDRVQVEWSGATWSRAEVVDSLSDYLQEWLEGEAAAFEDGEVRPLLETEARELDAVLEERLAGILDELDALRAQLRPRMEGAPGPARPDLSATERVLSALGGFVMGGPGGAVEGATFGWRNVVGGLPVYLSVGLALALTGVSLPVALGVVTGVGVLRTWLTGKDAAERLREEVQRGFQDAFERELARMAVRVEDEVCARYLRLVEAVDAATGAVISELEEELAEVRRRHRAGEAALEAGMAELDAHRDRLDALASRLHRLQSRLAG